jgi:hypothetical protein
MGAEESVECAESSGCFTDQVAYPTRIILPVAYTGCVAVDPMIPESGLMHS